MRREWKGKRNGRKMERKAEEGKEKKAIKVPPDKDSRVRFFVESDLAKSTQLAPRFII